MANALNVAELVSISRKVGCTNALPIFKVWKRSPRVDMRGRRRNGGDFQDALKEKYI